MSASYNFRTAFNGFNREDVVHYIEYMNTKHTTLVNQLRSDLAAAQKEASELKAQPQQAPAPNEQINELLAKIAQLEEEVLATRSELADMTAQRDAALSSQSQAAHRNDEELEAYRRAERVERQAKERADALYQKANDVLTEATAKVDNASAQIAGIADQVAAQLAVLQQAVTGSKTALKDAAATLYSMSLTAEE